MHKMFIFSKIIRAILDFFKLTFNMNQNALKLLVVLIES